MTYGYFTIMYGTIVTWGALKSTHHVPNNLKSGNARQFINRSFHQLNGLQLEIVDAHDFIEHYEKNKSERLPQDYPSIVTPEMKEADPDGDNRLLLCIGEKLGTIFITGSGPDTYPDLDDILAGKQYFDSQIAQDLKDIGGKPNLHFIPDDCGCCS